MEVSEELMLTWGSHQLTLVNEVAQLRHQGCFADVTLACEGRLYPAHKFILAMCSDYFRNIFGPSGVGGSNSNLVVVLKDVACQDVEHLLDYMYTGVVAVEKSGLHSLIKTAENLQIKGLAFSDTPDPAPSPQRPDPPTYVGGASRHEEVVTEDNSLANSRRINTMGPDVRLNRGGSSASRVPVNARETISPPSKRKKLLDSVGQATGNPSNTSTTFTNNVRTSCSVSQQQMYSSKRRVPSPSGQPSSSSPSDVPAMPLFTEPQSPVLLPASPHQFRQHGGSSALASKCFKDSPERSPGVSEHHPVPSCSVPMVVSSSSQAVSMMVGHNPKDGGHSAEVEVSRDIVDRPENLEIKKEEPDGEAVIGAATEIHLAVEGGPSNETSELKEEPPPEEGESGPSGLHAGLECWGTAVTEGGLLADAADEDEISDTDATGDEDTLKRLPPEEEARSPPSAVHTDFKTEPEVSSPALFSMPATPASEVVTSSALIKAKDCVLAATVAVSEFLKLDKDVNAQGILSVCSSAPVSSVDSAFGTYPPVADAGDREPSVSQSEADCTAGTSSLCTKAASLLDAHGEILGVDATCSKDRPKFAGKSFEDTDRDEVASFGESTRSGVRKGIGKSIFEVASPIAKIEESEQNVSMSASLFSDENGSLSKVDSDIPSSTTCSTAMSTSGPEYSSAVCKFFSGSAVSAKHKPPQKTYNLGLIQSATKSKLFSTTSRKSSTSLVFSSSTIPSLLGSCNEQTLNNESNDRCSSQEEDKEKETYSQVAQAIESSKDTVSSISESITSNIISARSYGMSDHPKISPCTGTSANDRPFVDIDNPPSEASTVVFEIKSVPMSIDSESSPENPDLEDIVEPVSLTNPSGTTHCDDRLISNSSHVRNVSQARPLQASDRAIVGKCSYTAQPHSGPRNSTSTVRCTQCPYTTVSIAQLESHARELHPDFFSQTMRSFQGSARTDRRDRMDFRHQDASRQDMTRSRHDSDAQQKVDAVMDARNNQSVPTVSSKPSQHQMRSASREISAPPPPSVSDFRSDQVERYCNQAIIDSQRRAVPVSLSVNVSPSGEADVSHNYPSNPVSRLNASAPNSFLPRVSQLPPTQRMVSHAACDIQAQHDARDYSSPHGWHLAFRNPNQPPHAAGRFPALPVNSQISPRSAHRPQIPHQFIQPRHGPPQPRPIRNIAPSTSCSTSVTSTLQSEFGRSSELVRNNYVRMVNPPSISTTSTTPGSVPKQPPGSLHHITGVNPNHYADDNAGIRMSLPSPVHSSYSVANNMRVQPVRAGIFPRCNEQDLETVRQMAYPSVSGTHNVPLAALQFTDFSQPPQPQPPQPQPPQPQPFLMRSASARLTIQPESEKKFTCPYCYMTLFGRQTLFDHVSFHANNDPSTYRKSWCPYCTLKCVSQQQLVTHFKSHTAEEIG